nr:hypothetical protein [Streptomyces rochei]
MSPRVRVLPLLLAPLLLTACGTEPARDPVASVASAAGAAGESLTPDELESRAKAMGTAPELVHVMRLPPYTLARQSVGVLGDDGFSATYVAEPPAMIRLSVERGSMTEDTCRDQPVGDMSGERTTCEPDAGMWYRTGGGRHEYALPKNGYVVRLSAETAPVTRAVLRAAARSVHRPDGAEAAATLPSPRPATTPVPRGDLPPNGDGAPDNSVDIGG